MNENLLNPSEKSLKEDFSNDDLIIEKYGFLNKDPLSSSNFISRIFLYWAYKIIKMGNLIKLKSEYLGKLLGDYTSKNYLKSLKKIWEGKNYKNLKNFALLRAGFRANSKSIIIILFLTFIKSLINIVQIIIFREYMKKFNKENNEENFFSKFNHIEIGIFYLFLRLIEILFTRKSNELQNLLGFKSGIEFMCLIYEKILKISSAEMKNKINSGEIINFIQVDALKLTNLMLECSELLTLPFLIISYSYMLFKFFGISFIFGLFTLIAFLLINFLFQKKFKKIQKDQMKLKDKRMKIISETINNIKILKLNCWEDEFLKRINEARENEIKNLQKRFKISNINIAIGWFAPVATSVISIGAYQYFHSVLNIEDIFTSLGIFSKIRRPLRALPGVLNNFYETSISMARIEKFLNEKDLNENFIIKDSQELKNKGLCVKIENGCFSWGNSVKIEEEIENEKKSKKNKHKNKHKKRKNENNNNNNNNSNNNNKNILIELTDKTKTNNNNNNNLQTNYSSISDISDDDNLIINKINEIEPIEYDSPPNNNINKITLSDINLEISNGEFICIIGEVGSGKSSLLQSLLNSMIPTSSKSKIYTNGSISYVSQIPWIQNATVRENIIFCKEFNLERYNKIIEICELKPDLEILSGGDLTEIGEKGINLSGGQKARIAIARALYSDNNIFLFDDPISALDANVGMKIIKNCIIKFLNGKTRILVTHALQFVSFSDRIIYMKDGKINWVGKYEDIKKENFFKDFYEKMNKKHHNENNNFQRKTSSEKRNEFLTEEEEENENKNINELNNGKIKRITKDEIKEEGRIKLIVFKKYFKEIRGLFLIISMIIFLLLMDGFKGASDIWLGYWSENKNNNKNTFYFIIYSLLGLTGCVFNYFKTNVSYAASIKGSKIIHKQMIENIIRAPICTFHETTPKGQILNRFSKDINSLDIRTIRTFNLLMTAIMSFITSILICSFYQPYCILFLPILSIIGYKITNFYVNCSRELHRLEGISRSPGLNLINETIPGTTTIRAFNYTKKYLNMFHERMDEHLKMKIIISGTKQWYDLILDLLSFSFIVFLISFTIIFKDNFSAQTIGILLNYCINIQQSLIHGLNTLSNFENSVVDLERCLQYTDIKSEAPKTKELDNDKKLKNWPNKGKIEFINYSVKYRPDTEIVLKNINFTINPKEKIGIVGRTGSGKSTITLCLFRIIEPLSGKILIDDVDITKIGLDKLRKNLTIIPQDPALMEGTLRYNIDPLNLNKDIDIINIMEKIGFNYIIENNPLGINQIIQEGGSNLSVGEKQLICITRAILRKSKIIIMDEATANIDYQTEEIIQKAINEILNNSSVITIAHRIKTIINSDKIIVLENGEIVDFDTPKKLLENKNGLFYNLYSKSTL